MVIAYIYEANNSFTISFQSLHNPQFFKMIHNFFLKLPPPCCGKLSHPCLPNRAPETGRVLRPFLFFLPDLAEGLGSAYKKLGIWGFKPEMETWVASQPCQSSPGTQFPQGMQLHKELQGRPKERRFEIKRRY